MSFLSFRFPVLLIQENSIWSQMILFRRETSSTQPFHEDGNCTQIFPKDFQVQHILFLEKTCNAVLFPYMNFSRSFEDKNKMVLCGRDALVMFDFNCKSVLF